MWEITQQDQFINAQVFRCRSQCTSYKKSMYSKKYTWCVLFTSLVIKPLSSFVKGPLWYKRNMCTFFPSHIYYYYYYYACRPTIMCSIELQLRSLKTFLKEENSLKHKKPTFYKLASTFILPPSCCYYSRSSDPGSQSRVFSLLPTRVLALHFFCEKV